MTSHRRTFLGATAAAATVGLVAGQAQAAQPGGNANAGLGKTKHHRFAVNVEMWFTKHPFTRRIEEAAKLGFPAIEFWPWRNKDIGAIAKTCEKFKIEVAQFTAWGFTPGLNDPKNHAAFVKEVQASIGTAKQLNCRLLTVVGGNDIPGMTQKQMHQNIINGLRLAAPHAEKAGITLILEPMNIRVDHKGHCLYGSEQTTAIIKAVNSPRVKINWDLYHMQISEGDLCGHLRDGAAALGYVQIADHPGRNEPGTGEIHYQRVFKELWDMGYKGYIGLELRPRKSEVEAAQAVAAADNW
jgi:hydroxypyruvate isomerase